MGHDVDEEGIHVNGNKAKTIQNWPVPTNLGELRSFLGFAQFFKQFIKDYSRIVLPLTELTRGGNRWAWTAKEQAAFEELQLKLSSAPTLHIIDAAHPNAKLEVHTDASGYAVGAVLY